MHLLESEFYNVMFWFSRFALRSWKICIIFELCAHFQYFVFLFQYATVSWKWICILILLLAPVHILQCTLVSSCKKVSTLSRISRGHANQNPIIFISQCLGTRFETKSYLALLQLSWKFQFSIHSIVLVLKTLFHPSACFVLCFFAFSIIYTRLTSTPFDFFYFFLRQQKKSFLFVKKKFSIPHQID